jgi:hypothetical protein
MAKAIEAFEFLCDVATVARVNAVLQVQLLTVTSL